MKTTKAVGFAIAAAITLSLLSVSFARPTTTKAETAGLAETRQTAVQSMNNADCAQQNVDLADRSFLDFILSDANFAGNVEYSRSPLYDAELQERHTIRFYDRQRVGLCFISRNQRRKQNFLRSGRTVLRQAVAVSRKLGTSGVCDSRSISRL